MFKLRHSILLLSTLTTLLLVTDCLLMILLCVAQGQKPARVEKDSIKPQGSLSYKLPTWDKFWPVKGSMTLMREHQLRLKPNVSAMIICGDDQKKSVPSGDSTVAEICPNTSSRTPPTRTNPPRGGEGDFYVISPRGQIIGNNIIIRWNGITGAERYEVYVNDKQLLETTKTEIPYQGPKLKAVSGNTILVKAYDNNNQPIKSSKETNFSILSDLKSQEIRRQIEEINQQDISKESKVLFRVDVYKNAELYTDAIKELEKWKKTNNVEIYFELAEIYFLSGLDELAEESYKKTLELSEEQNDLEQKALALLGLAEIEETYQRTSKARELYEKADAVCQQLGYNGSVGELESRIYDCLGIQKNE